MGPVNRCWKCGTPFKRVEGKPNPPIRRAPVLATYLYPETDDTAAVAVVEIDEETEVDPSSDPSEPVTAVTADAERDVQPPPRPLMDALRSHPLLNPDRVDYPCIATAMLAGSACLLGTSSILAIPIGIAAAILSVHLLGHRATIWRWICFALGVMAMIVALLGAISFIYSWWLGGNLFTILLSPPI